MYTMPDEAPTFLLAKDLLSEPVGCFAEAEPAVAEPAGDAAPTGASLGFAGAAGPSASGAVVRDGSEEAVVVSEEQDAIPRSRRPAKANR